MYGWVDGCTCIKMQVWMGRHGWMIDAWVRRWMNDDQVTRQIGWVDRSLGIQMDAYMSEWMDGWID